MLHAGELGNHRCLVDTVGSLRPLVELLQPHNVGRDRSDHLCDSLDISTVVLPLSVVDVVTEDSDLHRLRRYRRGWRKGRG